MAGDGPAAGTQTEVETKLEVPAGAAEAVAALLRPGSALQDLPGVAEVRAEDPVELVATYHDTPRLHLLRARATLRRRTGGEDAGWHLKLPGREAGSRTEVHEPLGADDGPVPERLAALSRSRHRGRPLAPVAVLRTRRRVVRLLDADGRQLVEVADDAVRTEVADALVAAGHEAASTWHEVEVELVDGDRDVLEAVVALVREAGAWEPDAASKLGRALAAAGALDAAGTTGAAARTGGDAPAAGSALAVVVEALRQHVERLVAEDALVRLDVPDSVHKARVAARRLRSDLATFRPVLGRGTTEPLRASLTELGTVLGRARDSEVLAARLRARLAALPPELVPGPVAGRLDADLDGAYERERAAAVGHLDSEEHTRLLEDLVRLCEDPTRGPRADAPARRTTRARARRAWRRVQRRLDAVPTEPGPGRDEALHEVRKATKRVRYAAEALADVHGRRASRLAGRAEDLQELLGEHQDAVVAADALRVVALRAYADGENTFGYGVLAGLERAATAGLGPDDPRLERAVRRLRRAAARWFD
ncbi:CYTH and CHAD domain-containing protein [Aquipuribacter sp. SD81]|uniref:CYTH and CHAD domain-containing protein n=1 Tax=Aquipuribacter sp. SD81 TaxID=3127703 RepID=UPI003018B864